MKLVEGILPGPSVQWPLPEVYWVARYDYHPNWGFDSHIHDFFQLIYVIDGRGTAEVGNKTIDLQSTRCLLIPPYVTHSLENDGGAKLRTIDLKFNVHNDELTVPLARFKGAFDDSDGAVRSLLEELHHEAVMGRSFHRELCCTLLMYILIIIVRKTENAESGDEEIAVPLSYSYPSDEVIKDVLNCIHQDFANSDLGLSDLADLVGSSKSYLEKKFRASMGVSIHRYIVRYRVYQAKELLRYSDDPIKEIATRTGFKTVHHFTRVFSEVAGVPPAKWRAFELRTGRKGVVLSPRFYNVDITITE